jgi:hypothetical protein
MMKAINGNRPGRDSKAYTIVSYRGVDGFSRNRGWTEKACGRDAEAPKRPQLPIQAALSTPKLVVCWIADQTAKKICLIL